MRGLFLLATAFTSLLTHTNSISQDSIAFDLKDPKQVSGMTIAIDAPLEPVRGYAGGISGSININLADPAQSSGKIIVDSDTVSLINKPMTDSLRQPWCLDVKKYPTIEFVVSKIEDVKKTNGKIEAKVTGDFTLHGVTKPMTVDAIALYVPGQLKKRGGVPKDGDLIQIHSKFSINRLDYGIGKELSTDLIGNKVDIDLAATGVAFK